MEVDLTVFCLLSEPRIYSGSNNERKSPTILHADGFLAGKPSNTFLEAMEKVLEGLVKNGGGRALRK